MTSRFSQIVSIITLGILLGGALLCGCGSGDTPPDSASSVAANGASKPPVQRAPDGAVAPPK
jgi:hypothetical protein